MTQSPLRPATSTGIPRHLSWPAAAMLALVAVSQAQVATINVEVDYMVAADHTHRPTAEMIAALEAMFACHGITLNLLVDDAIPEIGVMQCPNPGEDEFFSCADAPGAALSAYSNIKALYSDPPGIKWHYCIFGHRYDDGSGNGSSGLAEINGDDLVVTMGGFGGGIGTPFQRASTFAHELGHNLGLRHATPTSSSVSGPYAPNYASVMSYKYQLRGVRDGMRCLGLSSSPDLFKNMDYSNGRLPDLREEELDEGLGLGIHTVDWDCDGAIDVVDVAVNLDGKSSWCGDAGAANSVLRDYDDWSNLVDVFNGALGAGGAGAGAAGRQAPYRDDPLDPVTGRPRIVRPAVSCMTRAEFDQTMPGFVDPTACPGSTPTLETEACQTGEMVWVDPGAAGDPAKPLGAGANPFPTLNASLVGLQPGSVIYLDPGTHHIGAGSLTISQAAHLAGPGVALVVE